MHQVEELKQELLTTWNFRSF